MINKLLSTAVKLYLRSQVSQVENLQLEIKGKNRQILKGCIPQIFLSCNQAVYQGLHLRGVQVEGNDIAVNLPEVLKNKPLKLIEPIVVAIKVSLDAKDLANSLTSELLQIGLTDLYKLILQVEQNVFINASLIASTIEWKNIAIANDNISFSGTYQNSIGAEEKLLLDAGISLLNSHTIYLSPLFISQDSNPIKKLEEGVKIDLGKDVFLETLVIESEQISCSGSIAINS